MQDDPMGRVLVDAERKLINSAISGNQDTLDERTVQLALWSYGIREIRRSNEALAEEIRAMNGGGKKEFAKRHGPAAGTGFGIGALLALVRDWLSVGGGG